MSPWFPSLGPSLAARVAFAVLAVAACGAEERTEPPTAPVAKPSTPSPTAAPAVPTGRVTITGRVLDSSANPVRGVDVRARAANEEASAVSGADGSFRLSVVPGEYRMFVRDERYMTVAWRQNPRIHGAPRAVTAGEPDTALLPIVDARTSIDALDLLVVRAITVTGRVLDVDLPIEGAVVRAQCKQRPVLGTDVTTSVQDGTYTLKLPAGERCILDATHSQFAGLLGSGDLVLRWDDPVERDLPMTRGCIITGKVIDTRGEPAGDGAIEKLEGPGEDGFGPSGQIAPDGTFRWATPEPGEVTIRAWPWRSPPAPARTFECRYGTRIDDVVFRLPAMTADLEGTLVDRTGHPLAFAFIDLSARSPGGIGQQERTDADGTWKFYNVPPGPYALLAHASGRGMLTVSVMAPEDEAQQLTLGATARLAGTTTALVDGSFEVTDIRCTEFADRRFQLDEPPRLVPVRAGAFAIEDLPACKLAARARWRQQEVMFEADLSGGSVATIELELGIPRVKRVYGVVRDEDGNPVADALIGARTKTKSDELTKSDARGNYSITAAPGAFIHASALTRTAERQVGAANVDEERIDLVLRRP